MNDPHSDFLQVLRLPLGELRALVAEGELAERVWAAWALGLRASSAAAMFLADAARNEPAAGVRRHLAVVLAGLGERDAVEVLATSDPDVRVRAAACRCLALLAPHFPAYWETLRARLAGDEDGVKETILQSLPSDPPESVVAESVRLLGEASCDVRRAVVDRLPEWFPPGRPLPSAVTDHAPLEPDDDLRKALLRFWLARAHTATVGAAVAARGVLASAVDLLDLVGADGCALAWADVEPLGRFEVLDVDRRLLHLFADRLGEPRLSWLLRCLARLPGWQALSVSILTQLLPRLRELVPPRVSPEDKRSVARLGEVAARSLEHGVDDDEWELDEWGSDEERAEYRRLLSSMVGEARRLG